MNSSCWGGWVATLSIVALGVACGEGSPQAPDEIPATCAALRWSVASPIPEHVEKIGFEFTLTPLPSGDVLNAGGPRGVILDSVDEIGVPVERTASLFSAERREWVFTPPMVHPRWGHTAALLHDGRVLVAGSYGYQVGMSNFQPRNDAELFVPAEESGEQLRP